MKEIVCIGLLGLFGFMSAEEAKPCVFCEIAAGTREHAMVYRGDRVVAFMTIGPRNPGHVLVIPVQHAANYLEVPSETLGEIMTVAQNIGQALQRTDLNAEGIQLIMNSGKASGQTVFHAHLHVIPRHAGDGGNEPRAEVRPPMAELEAVAARIRSAVKGPNSAANNRSSIANGPLRSI